MPSKDFEWVGCWMTPWNTLYAPLRISKALILCPQTCRGSKEGGKEGGEEGGKGGTYRANKCRVWAVGWAMTYCTHLSGFWDCTHGQWGSRAAGQWGTWWQWGPRCNKQCESCMLGMGWATRISKENKHFIYTYISTNSKNIGPYQS